MQITDKNITAAVERLKHILPLTARQSATGSKPGLN
jgi:hypothetical protein